MTKRKGCPSGKDTTGWFGTTTGWFLGGVGYVPSSSKIILKKNKRN